MNVFDPIGIFRNNMPTLLENLSFALFLGDAYRNTRVADLTLFSFKKTF